MKGIPQATVKRLLLVAGLIGLVLAVYYVVIFVLLAAAR
jgi:hypothetical protein